MKIPLRAGGLFSGAQGPVIYQVPGALYSDAKCDVLIGTVYKSQLEGGDMVVECQINESALPDDLDANALEYGFVVDESPEPGVGASLRQRSFFLSRKA